MFRVTYYNYLCNADRNAYFDDALAAREFAEKNDGKVEIINGRN